MLFDFDACDYTNLIKTSVQALSFTDELNSILEKYLDPVLGKSTIFPETFTNNLKTSTVAAAEAKVDEAKTAVIAQLDELAGGCVRRSLGETVLGQDGSQRMLTSGLTFGGLAASIQVIDGIVSDYILGSFFFIVLAQY